jgi:hypothetical protein
MKTGAIWFWLDRSVVRLRMQTSGSSYVCRCLGMYAYLAPRRCGNLKQFSRSYPLGHMDSLVISFLMAGGRYDRS